MVHPHTSFVCKDISGTEHTELTVNQVLHHHFDFDPEQSNPIISQDPPAYDNAP